VSNLGLPILLLVFLAAAVAIWVAGVELSNQTDVLSTRLHLGSALGGLILLALATNLPEIAIVTSAALAGTSAWRWATSSAASPSRPSCWPRWTPSAWDRVAR